MVEGAEPDLRRTLTTHRPGLLKVSFSALMEKTGIGVSYPQIKIGVARWARGGGSISKSRCTYAYRVWLFRSLMVGFGAYWITDGVSLQNQSLIVYGYHLV